MADYYAANRERLKARARERYHAAKGESARRYLANRTKVLDRHRERRGCDGEHVRAEARRRYAENPAPAIARANKRRAKLLRAGIGTDRAAYRAKVAEIRSAERIACEWCGLDVAKPDRRIDHVIPISRGGDDSAGNLCCACFRCNARKADKLPIEWLSEIAA
jgi:5-methylcytosine-specific restriction endonuclease McrA